MKTLVKFDGIEMGTLAMINGRTVFQYSSTFLRSGLPSPSPLHLPLKPGIFLCEKPALLNLPGCCYDSLPDAWGDKIAERWFQAKGRLSLDQVSPLEQLCCFVGDRGGGTLTYEPVKASDGSSLRSRLLVEALDLRRMELAARAVVEGDATEVIADLATLARAGSAGGARPKMWIALRDTALSTHIVAGDNIPPDYTGWLIKFDLHNADETDREWGRIEHACALMARAAGLRSANTRLIETKAEGVHRAHYAIERFDRASGGKRIHFHSLAGVMESDFSIGQIDYRDFFATTAALTLHNTEELLEVFRRMAFNVAARVRDDHGKNHGFLLGKSGASLRWRLAPVYDAVFASPTRFPCHAMPVAGRSTEIGSNELLALANEFDLPKHAVESILEQVRAAVARWPEFADSAKVSVARTAEIGSALPKNLVGSTMTKRLQRHLCTQTKSHVYIAPHLTEPRFKIGKGNDAIVRLLMTKEQVRPLNGIVSHLLKRLPRVLLERLNACCTRLLILTTFAYPPIPRIMVTASGLIRVGWK